MRGILARKYLTGAPVQGWDQAHKGATADRLTEGEAAGARLAEMCRMVQDLGERFFPNEASLSLRSEDCAERHHWTAHLLPWTCRT